MKYTAMRGVHSLGAAGAHSLINALAREITRDAHMNQFTGQRALHLFHTSFAFASQTGLKPDRRYTSQVCMSKRIHETYISHIKLPVQVYRSKWEAVHKHQP